MSDKDLDLILMDIVSQESCDLSAQDLDNIQSAISFMVDNGPKDSPKFKKSLERIQKKIWKFRQKVGPL